MDGALGLWMEDNSKLFRYAVDVLSLKGDINNILLSGGISKLSRLVIMRALAMSYH